VNYGDATSKIFEVDASGANLVPRELADLGHGVKAHAIAYEGGLTWIAGQFQAESDQTAQTAIWFIDQNGIPERHGMVREWNPSGYPIVSLSPYQSGLYAFTGAEVYRYDIRRGGLYREYLMNPLLQTQARDIAVTAGRGFCVYDTEVAVWGTEDEYRSAASVGGSFFQTSIYDFGLPGTVKTLVKVRIRGYASAEAPIQVGYLTEASANVIPIGTMTSSDQTFIVASSENPVTFNTLQIALTLNSADGSDSPFVYGVVVTAQATEQEEYFDLVLRCEGADSTDRIPGQQEGGDEKAAAVVSLWKAGLPFTFEDGYAFEAEGVTRSYLATIRDLRDERNAQGEGRVVVTLKVV
jgi:hypothetical protein